MTLLDLSAICLQVLAPDIGMVIGLICTGYLIHKMRRITK